MTHSEALYDAIEYLIAGPENQAEWWEHLGDAHRDYEALARAAESLRIALQDVQCIALNGLTGTPLYAASEPDDRLDAIDQRVTEALS